MRYASRALQFENLCFASQDLRVGCAATERIVCCDVPTAREPYAPLFTVCKPNARIDVNEASARGCRVPEHLNAPVVAWRRPCTLYRNYFMPARQAFPGAFPLGWDVVLARTMTPSQQQVEERKSSRPAGRTKGTPEISVVLVSDGCWQTMERSLTRVAPRCRKMFAEVIAISSGDEMAPAGLQAAHPEVRFCSAPVGSTESQLRSIAMLEATGDIVALRRAADCLDALWLDAHFRIATGLDPHVFDATYDGADEMADDDALGVELPTGAARRVAAPARHQLDPSAASSASSAA